MKLVIEVDKLTRGYASKGGKNNKQQQRARMIAFAESAAVLGANSLGQVGHRHVIQYWKNNRHLAECTAYNHWRAICKLWEFAGKSGEPPKYLPYPKI
jgi:hypothetical protein